MPHPEYAEDQPYARTFLAYHVICRGFQSGAVIGIGLGAARSLIRSKPIAKALLASTGSGAIIGTALMIPMLPMYMWNKTEIEWQDRTWRLLENEGQKEVDDWSSVGFVGGALATARTEAFKQAKSGRWVKFAGGAAVGDLIGVTGYMIWRYGIHRGKWPEKVQ